MTDEPVWRRWGGRLWQAGWSVDDRRIDCVLDFTPPRPLFTLDEGGGSVLVGRVEDVWQDDDVPGGYGVGWCTLPPGIHSAAITICESTYVVDDDAEGDGLGFRQRVTAGRLDGVLVGGDSPAFPHAEILVESDD